MSRWAWGERLFNFDFPPEKFPDLLERLRSTPARLEDRLADVHHDILTYRDGRGWSILENVGHLIDLGYLPAMRLEQILAGETVLVAADMSNRKTQEANHNDCNKSELLAEFRSDRKKLVERLESLDETDWAKSALHPRLNQPMRVVDIVYFDSEHDDYHLARIGALLTSFVGNKA